VRVLLLFCLEAAKLRGSFKTTADIYLQNVTEKVSKTLAGWPVGGRTAAQ
jgi:hypothetical protein